MNVAVMRRGRGGREAVLHYYAACVTTLGIVTMPLLANSDAEILQCFPVMAELRTYLVEGEFVARIRRQQRETGYQLAYIE